MSTAPSKIVIAIDFGTTFSGAGWLHTGISDPTSHVKDIEILQDFPGRLAGRSDKVPTEVTYDPAAKNGYRWGYESSGETTWKYFKLQLDPKQAENAYKLLDATGPVAGSNRNGAPDVLGLRSTRTDTNKTPPEVTTDYLRALKTEIMEKLRRQFGPRVIEDTPRQYILTVPAVWSDAAKAATKHAARNAGFGYNADIKLIAEPEAAAIYCLKSMPIASLAKGSHFVVCDAGGGTVDLITYQVTSLSPLTMKESVVGDGDLCGSIYLNGRFEQFLARKLEKFYRNRTVTKALLKSKAMMSKEFDESIKPNFINNPSITWPIRLPAGVEDDIPNGIEDGYLNVTNEEVRTIFDPVVAQTLRLISKQVKAVKRSDPSAFPAIFLVGGFGSNEYLKSQVEAFLGPQYTVYQPRNAWSAVARGALLWGADDTTIPTRKARRFYGSKTNVPFNDAIHPQRLKHWCEFEQKYMCYDVMDWHVEAGQDLSHKAPVLTPYYRNFSMHSTLEFTSELWAWDPKDSDDLDAPEYKTDECYKVGSLYIDLTSIDNSKLKRYKRPDGRGTEYFKLCYEVAMNFESQISFSLKYEGKEMNAIEIEYTAAIPGALLNSNPPPPVVAPKFKAGMIPQRSRSDAYNPSEKDKADDVERTTGWLLELPERGSTRRGRKSN